MEGLLENGYEVVVLHRGVHEETTASEVEHIHADPHFREPFADALAGRTFDLVLSTYGRLIHQADVLAGRCGRFLGVGGIAAYRGFSDPSSVRPYGMRVGSSETDPLDELLPGSSAASKFAQKMIAVERRVMELHAAGEFEATWFRYPMIYGPRNIYPREWSVIRRINDGRRRIILADGGLGIRTRAASRNAAHAVLLAVQQAETASGQIFNLGEDRLLSLREWVETLAGMMGSELEIVSLPSEIAQAGHALTPLAGTTSAHAVMDTTKIKTELGYSDVVSVEHALMECIEWYAEHPVAEESHPDFPDRFDYAREDALIEGYREAIGSVEQRVPWPDTPVVHGYAHPKAPGVGPDQRGR